MADANETPSGATPVQTAPAAPPTPARSRAAILAERLANLGRRVKGLRRHLTQQQREAEDDDD